MAVINGKEYSWVDVEITVEGKPEPLLGVRSIEYGVKRENGNVMGKGKEPIAQWRGQKQPDGCKLTLLQSEFEAWQKSLPKGFDLTDLPAFNITISYAPIDGPRVTDRLLDVMVNNVGKATGYDKKEMEIPLDLTVRKVLFNVL